MLNILIHIDIQLQSKQNAYSIKGFIIHVWMFAVWKVSGLDIVSGFFFYRRDRPNTCCTLKKIFAV